MDNPQIRLATSDDAEAVSRLHRLEWQDAFGDECIYPENGEQRWRDELVASRLTVILAEEKGTAIAHLVFRRAEQEIEITDLFVIESHRRKGIAIRLLNSLFEQTTGAQQFSLWVAESNVAAKSLYKQFGFKETGELRAEHRRVDNCPMMRLTRSGANQRPPNSLA